MTRALPAAASGTQTGEWFAADEEETMRAGGDIGSRLQPGTLVLLEGPLGAGKTTLMKGLVEALGAGVREDVTSPTFTLVHEYISPELHIFHLDVYRLQSERELDGLGIDEMTSTPASMVLVEWGLKFPLLARQANQVVRIERHGNGRRIRLMAAHEGISQGA